MFAFLTILGGVALLTFGVRYLRKGLDRLFGPRIGPWMQQLASRPGWSFFAGLFTSLVAPSSTTMTLLAVQTVRAGHLTARQMLTIMLGANIGLTIMVVLLAFRLERVAPIIILVGVILYQFTRVSRTRGVGQVLLAIGFIFIAIDVMRGAAEGLLPAGGEPTGVWAIVDFHALQLHPFLLAGLAAVMALAIQSSTATIGLLISLGAAEAVTFRFAVPAVIGANVGLALTGLVVAWRHLEPRRLALGNLLLKSAVAVPLLLLTGLVGAWLPEPGSATTFAIAIAALHTGFNMLVAAVGLPLVGTVTSLTERLLPTPPHGAYDAYAPRYIDHGPLAGVAMALGQSLREIGHMSEIVRGMLQDVWLAMQTEDERLARDVSVRDDHVDRLDTEVKRFLTRLGAEQLGEQDAAEQLTQLRYLTELETIGDIIDKNLAELVLKKLRLRAEFSAEGERELQEFYDKVLENIVIAETLFTTRDRTLAQQLLRHKERIDQFERELRDRHFARLTAGLKEAHETSAIHLDLLTHLRRINSCVSHIAYAILQDTRIAESTNETGAGE